MTFSRSRAVAKASSSDPWVSVLGLAIPLYTIWPPRWFWYDSSFSA